MLILGMDTSSDVLSIALAKDKKIIFEHSEDSVKKHSSMLVPMIGSILDLMKFKLKDIDGFIIGIGPGSFTGLRVGVATVKGFGLATGKPCIGIPSIDAIANFVEIEKKWIVPVIDAKKNQIYSALYRYKDGMAKRYSEYLLLSIERLLKKIKGDAIFLGDGVRIFKEKISSLKKDSEFFPEDFWYPRASELIRLGRDKIERYKESDLNRLLPLYIYPKECQIK